MKIKVGGYRVKLVHMTEADMPEKDGHFFPSELVIGIREGQLLRLGQDTLLHECLHAVLYLNGITTTLDIDEQTEEKLVFQLANGLLALLQDNPRLVKALMAKKEPREALHSVPPATLDATPTRRATA